MNSIRRRLTTTILPGFGLLLVFSSAAIYFLTRAALLREFDSGLRSRALTIMSLTEQGRDGIQVELPDPLFRDVDGDTTPQFYELWQTNGTVLARSDSLNTVDLPRHSGSATEPVYWNLGIPGGRSGRAIGLKFAPKSEDEGAKLSSPSEAIIVVAADRRSLDSTLATLAGVLVLTGLLTVIITVPLVSVSLRQGHAPLEELARRAAAINADSLHTRFPVDSLPTELRPIATRMNDLLARLQASFERERRFSADLAHELRTPLAELRSHAEVAMEWPEGEATEKHRQTLEIALQMEAMVTRLLELTRCENGKISPQFESVLLAPLVQQVWQSVIHKANGRKLAFVFDMPQNATIQTDRTLFRSILANLFSNAVEYSPTNGRGEIRWAGDRGEFTVSNSVHDLNADDVPHLFERLWRKDKSRTGSEHCGLGLALTREFAELLGFDIQARFTDERTLTISLKARKPEKTGPAKSENSLGRPQNEKTKAEVAAL